MCAIMSGTGYQRKGGNHYGLRRYYSVYRTLIFILSLAHTKKKSASYARIKDTCKGLYLGLPF